MPEPSLSSPQMHISALQGVHCVAHSPLGHGKSDVLTAPAVQQAAEQAGKTAAQVGGAPSQGRWYIHVGPASRVARSEGTSTHVGIHTHLSKTMLACMPCNRNAQVSIPAPLAPQATLYMFRVCVHGHPAAGLL